MTTNAPAIDFAALLDLPTFKEKLEEFAGWYIQKITEMAGLDDGGAQVTSEIIGDPWGLVAHYAQSQANGTF